ncbi:MAG TPA: BrnT family toxin [Dissulfurispiraceae bacterium]|nr:BrnT family toxin [Dissulfurispiraceae bacterium]
MIDLNAIEGFDWDAGNARKNEKHGVSQAEAEQIFFNEPLIIVEDEKHSHNEERYQALGKTNDGRLLHTTYTLREHRSKIRIISARPMAARERKIYEAEIHS